MAEIPVDEKPGSAPPSHRAGENTTLDAAAYPPSRPAHTDPAHVGPYRMLEKIGEGGYGIAKATEGRWLASGGVDSSLRLWDITPLEKPAAKP